MKLRITLKDPDGVYDSLDDGGFNPREFESSDNDEIRDVFEKYVEFQEYVTIEMDTVTGVATVVPLRADEDEDEESPELPTARVCNRCGELPDCGER